MKNSKITSLRIAEEDIKILDEISIKENLNRSILVQKAVKKFIQEYGKERSDPNMILNHRINELENKFSNLLTRVNVLTNQIDKLLQKSQESDKSARNIYTHYPTHRYTESNKIS